MFVFLLDYKMSEFITSFFKENWFFCISSSLLSHSSPALYLPPQHLHPLYSQEFHPRISMSSTLNRVWTPLSGFHSGTQPQTFSFNSHTQLYCITTQYFSFFNFLFSFTLLSIQLLNFIISHGHRESALVLHSQPVHTTSTSLLKLSFH